VPHLPALSNFTATIISEQLVQFTYSAYPNASSYEIKSQSFELVKYVFMIVF